MSEEEAIDMLLCLESISDEHFQEFVRDVKTTKMSQGTREFLKLAIKIANKKRQSKIAIPRVNVNKVVSN